MKLSLLQFLECPECRSEYSLNTVIEDVGEVMEGQLTCRCGSFPIIRGVPRLLPKVIHEQNWETAKRFGEEWKQFDMLTEQYEKQFLSWIEPVQCEDFKGKIVFDVGCGKGRHILQAKKFGAEQVIGVDLSQAVDVAFDNVGRMEGVHIIQCDIYSLPFKQVFDYAYSIGVLHHTPNPGLSFQKMVEKVKLGGSVSAWVYGREGNGWIIYILNPIRRVTSKLPLVVTKGLAFILACIMQAGLVCLYRPTKKFHSLKWLRMVLPYNDYLCSISEYSFRENFSIVFDHLLPEIAYYIPRQEFQKWFDDLHLKNVIITQRYGNSWRGFGMKPTK
jgi:SAM-dependent methyltransferase